MKTVKKCACAKCSTEGKVCSTKKCDCGKPTAAAKAKVAHK